MTTVIPETGTETQWGVLHRAHRKRRRSVDVKTDEAAARIWWEKLQFCGNNDAVLVAWDADVAAWIPVGAADTPVWGFTNPMGSAEVAELLKVDVRTVNRWAKAGRLAAAWSPSLSRNGHNCFSRQQVEHILAGGNW